MDRKVRGITIMEVLVVIAILSILAGVALISLMRQVNQARLREGINLVIGALEEARRLSASNPNMHGVVLSDNTVKLCKVSTSCTPDCNNNLVRPFNLPSGVTVQELRVISYDRMGYPRDASCGIGMNNIVITSEPLGISKTICINRYGRIRVVEGQGPCPQD